MKPFKLDAVLAGVGGQGVLSAAAVLSLAALKAGLQVKQGEIHGMSQRGGSVQAQLRMSSEPIASDLIPQGSANAIISMEPIEGLRYLDYLAPDGILVTSSEPFDNIADYPDLDELMARIGELPRSVTVPAGTLARKAGSGRADNVVMVGAASPHLPLDPRLLEEAIVDIFTRKGEKVVRMNLDAFHLGRAAAVEMASAR